MCRIRNNVAVQEVYAIKLRARGFILAALMARRARCHTTLQKGAVEDVEQVPTGTRVEPLPAGQRVRILSAWSSRLLTHDVHSRTVANLECLRMQLPNQSGRSVVTVRDTPGRQDFWVPFARGISMGWEDSGFDTTSQCPSLPDNPLHICSETMRLMA